jgi:hypothetical protein
VDLSTRATLSTYFKTCPKACQGQAKATKDNGGQRTTQQAVGCEQIRKTQDEPQWIVVQGLLSALTSRLAPKLARGKPRQPNASKSNPRPPKTTAAKGPHSRQRCRASTRTKQAPFEEKAIAKTPPVFISVNNYLGVNKSEKHRMNFSGT